MTNLARNEWGIELPLVDPMHRVAASPQHSIQPSLPPMDLGRYKTIGALGHGGMATVYLADSGGEAGFSRLVAVKVLHPHLAEQEDVVSMLLDEARLAARIHHPHVVPVLDLQLSGGQPYIVMDYVEGCSLSALLKRERAAVPLRVIVTVVLDVLNGLHAAHTLTESDGTPLNIIHRDVTPQNILIGVDGMARLTDFGIALAKSSLHHTRSGEIKGKVAFMAPEQIRLGPLDHRTDIFSVGCLLWLALTGESLFHGATDHETASNVLDKAIPAPSSRNRAIPRELDAICMRALARKPESRWQSAVEMEEALRAAALSGDLIASRREIGDWVERSHQQELHERRCAVRDATANRTGSLNLTSHTPWPRVSEQLLVSKAGRSQSGSASLSLNSGMVTNGGATRSRWALMGAGAALLCSLGLVSVWFAGKRDTTSNSSSAVSKAADTPRLEPGRSVTPELPPAVSSENVAPEPGPVQPVSSPEAQPREPRPAAGKQFQPVAARPRRNGRTSSANGAPDENRPPPTSLPPPVAPAWDKDSPLPPQ